MKNFAVTLVVPTLALGIVVALGSGCGRNNPRLTKITEKTGDTSVVTTLTYDDKGHPSKIEVNNDPLDELYELTFTDAKLTQAKLTESFAGQETTKTTTTSKYTYGDGDKLASVAVSDATGDVQKIEITYDSSDRITSIVTSQLNDPQHSKSTNALSYGADGVTKNELTVESDGGKQTLSTATLAYANGRVSKLTIASSSENGSITPRYSDGGVLQSLVKDLEEQGDVTDKGTIAFTYDGSGHMTKADDSGADTTKTYEYDDGNVADLDVTPNDLGFSFDLTGKSWGVPDNHTQAPRLANLNW